MTHSPGAASRLLATLEAAWAEIRSRHSDVPEAVLVLASGGKPRGMRLILGHFAASRWELGGAERPEVLISGEGLKRDATEVLGTLLHEAAHGMAATRKIQDTSRGSRYHNRRYRALASELGLQVEEVSGIGWAQTSVPRATAEAYQAVLGSLSTALVLWRRTEASETANPGKSRNLLSCTCSCGRIIRVAKATLAMAPILCGACNEPFLSASPDHGQTRLDA